MTAQWNGRAWTQNCLTPEPLCCSSSCSILQRHPLQNMAFAQQTSHNAWRQTRIIFEKKSQDLILEMMLDRERQLIFIENWRGWFRNRSSVVFFSKVIASVAFVRSMHYLKFVDRYILRHTVRVPGPSSVIFMFRGYIWAFIPFIL